MVYLSPYLSYFNQKAFNFWSLILSWSQLSEKYHWWVRVRVTNTIFFRFKYIFFSIIFHCGRFRKRELYRLCLFETLVCYWKFKKFFNRTRASSYENFHRSIFVQMFQKRSETEKEFFLKKKKRTKKKTSSKCLYVHVKLNVKNFRHSSVRKKKWIHYVRASKADTYSRWRRKNWVLYSKKFQERWSVQFVSVFFFIIVIIIV